MALLSKLLGIAGMGSSIVSLGLMKRLISGLTVVIVFTAMAATLAGMLLVVGFYMLYTCFMHHGLDSDTALMAVAGIAFVVTLLFATMAYLRWRELLEMPRLLHEATPAGQISRLADAFMDGFLAGDRGRRDR